MTLTIGLMGLFNNLFAQNVSGKIVDVDNEPIVGVNCLLLNLPDSTQVTGTTTNLDGVFELKASKGKEYILHVSFIGFEAYTKLGYTYEAVLSGTLTEPGKAQSIIESLFVVQHVVQNLKQVQ